MTIDGSRIGFGRGSTKKLAQKTCYIDVAVYLETFDPSLWRSFVEAAKTGRDLGMAPPVWCTMSESLEDEVYELCVDIKKSTLYKNALKLRPSLPHPDVPQIAPSTQSASRRQREPSWFEEKDRILKERREKYLTDSAMESMRTSRAALPITVHTQELLDQIRDNDVTICMATTGSGKTTQIPQLILDDCIDRGEGSRCNIICTQPRRLAAVSVAQRVAKERGEKLGASIGYQVRFENKPPEEQGSITFCTIGIFLKRIQSALDTSGTSAQGHSLDDVTHIVVDEVHERDVDTDLLLVVLKRLLADRKANGKPIKVILMSATIDPTLFQQYFPDDQGQPSKTIEVPGRAFPVKKHFLDEFVSELTSIPGAAEAFAQDSVTKYVHHELGPAALQLYQTLPPRLVTTPATSRSGSGRSTPTQDGRDRGEELELPTPLVALTIAHVLRNSDEGHVLTFLPGWDEIQNVHRYLTHPTSKLGINFGDQSKWSIHLLHSTIPVEEQQLVFDPPPQGVRRIILSTNIAETSVTIPDVVYVVDTARIKEKRFDPERHISSLVSAWVGSSNLNQRAGRAGRHRPGEYFGIISQKRASELHPYQTVEMKRVDLLNIVMHVKALNFPGMSVEDVLSRAIEPPAAERVAAAMKDLTMVGALNAQKDLTPLGKVLLQLPVEVQVGRLVLLGAFFKCLDNALTLAAILTNRDPFVAPMHLKQESTAAKNSWTPSDFRSDVLAALRAYNAWWEIQGRGDYAAANRFCSNNFLSKPTLLLIQKIKVHLLQSLYHAGVVDVSMGMAEQAWSSRRKEVVVPPELDINRKSAPLLVALISAASQPNFAVRTGDKWYRTSQDKVLSSPLFCCSDPLTQPHLLQQVFIHPSSVNHRKKEMPPPDSTPSREKQIIAFAEKRQNISVVTNNPQKFIVTTTRLDPMSYMLFGAHKIQVAGRGLECDEWLPILGNQGALDQISRLKEAVDLCFLRVYEGIIMAKRNRHGRIVIPRPEEKEEESDDDGDETGEARERDLSLSSAEIGEFEDFTRNLVYILNQYSDERIASQSATNSRPATPVDTPHFGLSRLPSMRSGTSTPYNIGSAFNSRPGTPSRLRS
jgi:small subunit ribosomal protein S24e